MATIRLVPSTYAVSSSTYLSVSNAANMYTNTDSTTYATITNTYASTSSRYLYIRGFNFNDVPSNAIINSFTVKIKGYESGLATSTSYAPRLANGTSTISNTTAKENFGTSTKTIVVPTGALTWQQISSTYGSSFTIVVYVRRSSRNTTGYFYCYGAEIEVDYTIPVYHTVTSSTSVGTISPSGATSVLEGNDYTLTINASNPVATDNNVDVTSQLVRMTGGTDEYVPYNFTRTGFSVTGISNAYTNIESSTRATLSLSGNTTGTLYLGLGPINIPSNATITDISCQASLAFSKNGSSSSVIASCQLYSGDTAKGSSTSVVSSATDLSQTTFTLTPGTWSASELANAQFYFTAYNGASGTTRFFYVYGVSFTVTYTVNDEIYIYTITNVVGDHTIIISQGVTTKIYVKVGSWIEQSPSDWGTIFDTTANYVNKD